MFPARRTRHTQLAGNVISKSVTRNIIRNFCHQATTSTVKTERVGILTLWRRNYFLLISAHPVYKNLIIQEPNKLAL